MVYCPTKEYTYVTLRIKCAGVSGVVSPCVLSGTKMAVDNSNALHVNNVAPERVGPAALHLGWRRVPETLPFPRSVRSVRVKGRGVGLVGSTGRVSSPPRVG